MREIEKLRKIVEEVDKVNAEYILQNGRIRELFLLAETCKGVNRYNVAEQTEKALREEIRTFKERYLLPTNVKVGDGVTINLYTDRHAATVIKVTKSTVTVQRDKAILDPNFKPDFIPGGFAAHCTNQHEQSYTYERDESGEITKFHWSDKYQRYGQPGELTLSKGRHEFYDYNL